MSSPRGFKRRNPRQGCSQAQARSAQRGRGRAAVAPLPSDIRHVAIAARCAVRVPHGAGGGRPFEGRVQGRRAAPAGAVLPQVRGEAAHQQDPRPGWQDRARLCRRLVSADQRSGRALHVADSAESPDTPGSSSIRTSDRARTGLEPPAPGRPSSWPGVGICWP